MFMSGNGNKVSSDDPHKSMTLLELQHHLEAMMVKDSRMRYKHTWLEKMMYLFMSYLLWVILNLPASHPASYSALDWTATTSHEINRTSQAITVKDGTSKVSMDCSGGSKVPINWWHEKYESSKLFEILSARVNLCHFQVDLGAQKFSCPMMKWWLGVWVRWVEWALVRGRSKQEKGCMWLTTFLLHTRLVP